MSHYVVWVFTEEGEEFEAQELLERFDENESHFYEFCDETEELEESWKNKDRVGKSPAECFDKIGEFAKSWYGFVKVGGKWGYWHNPNAKWDWYAFGGRWDGYIGKKNIVKAEKILGMKDLDDKIPFAFINPSGDFVEHSTMGWWGISYDEKHGKDEWIEIVKTALKDNPESLIMVYDLHI